MKFTERKVQYPGKKILKIVDANNKETGEEKYVKLVKDEGNVIEAGTPITAETLNKGNWRDDNTLSFMKKNDDAEVEALENQTQIVTYSNGKTYVIPPKGKGQKIELGNNTESEISYRLKGRDRRHTNEEPRWYLPYGMGIIKEFKLENVIGIPGGSSYCALVTIVPWHDSSGGLPTQIAYLNNGKIYVRNGIIETQWGSWKKNLTEEDIENKVDKSGTITINGKKQSLGSNPVFSFSGEGSPINDVVYLEGEQTIKGKKIFESQTFNPGNPGQWMNAAIQTKGMFGGAIAITDSGGNGVAGWVFRGQDSGDTLIIGYAKSNTGITDYLRLQASSNQFTWKGKPVAVLGNDYNVKENDYETTKYLRWKNYGTNHLIIDASNATTPNGAGIPNNNAQIEWGPSHPMLVGWNNSHTYGVKVDSASRWWSLSHPSNYYLRNDWDGTYWNITSNHGAPSRVGYADKAGNAPVLLFDSPTFDCTIPSKTPEIILDIPSIGEYKSYMIDFYDDGIGEPLQSVIIDSRRRNADAGYLTVGQDYNNTSYLECKVFITNGRLYAGNACKRGLNSTIRSEYRYLIITRVRGIN